MKGHVTPAVLTAGLFLFSLLVRISDVAAEDSLPAVTITVPSPPDDFRNLYTEAVLTSALRAAGFEADIAYFSFPGTQSRLDKLLKDGKGLDVAWLPVTPDRLTALKYIPVPLYRGLHGHRIMVIRGDSQAKFNTIDSLEGLAELVAIQSRHWADHKVLVNNNLTVNGEFGYMESMKALVDGFGDYFPRSALTVAAEVRRNQALSVDVEQNLLLVYPSYFFLFVANHNPDLHQQLSEGMRNLIASGEMRSIFDRFYAEKIKTLSIDSRRTLFLNNDQVPAALGKELLLDW